MTTHHDRYEIELSESLEPADEQMPEPLDYWNLQDFEDILPRECLVVATDAVYAD